MNWPVMLVVAGVVIAAIVRLRPKAPSSSRLPFTPNPANDTEVLCTGWEEIEIEKALVNFRSAYREQLDPAVTFQTAKLGDEQFRITFPNDIPPDLLPFFVNYLQYPEGLDLAGHQVAVLARVTLTADFPLPRSDYVGQTARIYVPANDREYDLVYVAIGSDYFEQSFKDLQWKPVPDGRISDGVGALW